jgi:hypothetical protein
MRINTRFNRIELTKRERETLVNAAALLKLINKHGDDSALNALDTACGIETVLAELEGVDESTLVGAK